MRLPATLLQDVRFAGRRIWRNRTFSLAVILSFALGIGANASMLALLDALLMRAPAHVRAPRELVEISVGTIPDYETLARDSRTFASVGTAGYQSLTTESAGGAFATVRALYASTTYFSTLGTTPLLGRFPAPDEQQRGAAPVAVLSASMWRRLFGGRRDLLGHTMRLGGKPFSIIGVAPEGFAGFGRVPADVFLPLQSAALFMGEAPFADRRITWLRTLGRLRPGHSIQEASLEVTTLLHRAREADPRFAAEIPPAPVRPLLEVLRESRESAARVTVWVALVAAIVLLVAALNVANLVALQSAKNRYADAIHAAIGATTGRVLQMRAVELVLLGAAGAAAGVTLATLILRVAVALLAPMTTLVGLGVDLRFVGICVATALVALAVGFLPALLTRGHPDLGSVLRLGMAAQRPRGLGGRQWLVGGQLVVVTVLLIGAGAFQKSVRAVQATDLGVSGQGLYVVPLDFESIATPPAQIRARLERVRTNVGMIPSVAGTADVVGRTFLGEISFPQSVPGRDSLPSVLALPYVSASIVSPNFLQVVGPPVIVGRAFEAADAGGDRRVMVVSRRFAEAYWPGENALGRCVHIFGGGECTTIVGVVKDRRGLPPDTARMAEYYVPSGTPGVPVEPTAAFSPHVLLVRATSGRSGLESEIARAVRGELPTLPLVQVRALQELLDPGLRSWRLGARLFTSFAVLAFVLGAVGVYGVFSMMVEQRRREFAVRMALGADTARLARVLLADLLRLVGLAAAVGLVIVWTIRGVTRPLLFATSTVDLAVVLPTAALLIVLAILATLRPIGEVARIEPAVLLRSE